MPARGSRNLLDEVNVEHHGTLALIRPVTDAADRWLHEHVQADAQWFGDALVVEPRYLEPILLGLAGIGEPC